MVTIEFVLRILVAVFYAFLAAQYLMLLFRRAPLRPRMHVFGFRGVIALTTLFLIVRSLSQARCPFGNVFEALMFLIWLITIFYLFLEKHTREPWPGVLIVPLCAVFAAVSMALVNSTEPLPAPFKSPLFPFHVFSTLCAYVFFFLSFIASVLYLKQFSDIKRKRQGLLYGRVPALEDVGHYIHTSALIGWALLAAGIIIGVVWMRDQKVPLEKVIIKVLATGIVFCVYSALLIVRKVRREDPRKLALISIAGFACIVLTISIGKHAF
jgi:ABC-type transport system involved in cytochrome c biogenesis permease subunit